MKKYVALCIVLLAIMIFPVALAQTYTSGDYQYTVSDNRATIMGYSGTSSTLNIPATIGGYPVNAIGYNAFMSNSKLISVIIPEGVVAIGSQAFYGCSQLASVSLPESLATIEHAAFRGCIKLTSVTLPPKIIKLESAVFSECYGLTSIEIKGNISSIGDSAFYRCNLASVNLPDTVTSIGETAFYECANLKTINLPDGICSIGNQAFDGCSSLTSIDIPASMTTISNSTFNRCSNLKTLTLPDGLLTIEAHAFANCTNLKNVVFPANLTSIGAWAFQSCSSLAEIKIPSKVIELEHLAFCYCTNLVNVYITPNVVSIDTATFIGSDSVVVITEEGSYAHQWCIDNGVPFRLEQPQDDYLEKLSVKPEDFETFTYLCMSKMATLPFEQLKFAVGEDALWIVEHGGGFTGPIWNESTWGRRDTNKLAFSVSYNDLFKLCLNNWRICRVEQNQTTGYGVTVFINDQKKEIVIAYRASDPLNSEAFLNDWVENDFILYLTDRTGPQLPEALTTYKKVLADCPNDYSITLTGHSLGGGLALAVSTLENTRARSFNSVPMFSSVFANYPSQINLAFDGVDKLDHRDFISEHDIIAGLWDTQKFISKVSEIIYPLRLLGTLSDIKNATNSLYKQFRADVLVALSTFFVGEQVGETWEELLDALLDFDVRLPNETFEKNHYMFKDHMVYSLDINSIMKLLECHDVHSLFSITGNEFHFNQILDAQEYTETDYAYFSRTGTAIQLPPWSDSAPINYSKPNNSNIILGATGSQKLSAKQATNVNDMIYGGNGNDQISAFDGEDVLIGGAGNDILSGDTGNDQYVYTKGDGQDIIYDISGNTHIYLEGFEKTDRIECRINDSTNIANKKSYHGIYCNGDRIISVCIDRASSIFEENSLQAGSLQPTQRVNWLYIHKDGEVIKIADEQRHTCTRYVFQCPVAIQIFDQNQRMIATIESGENQSLFTEYGHFYAFEEEDGSYGKVIELFEGYSLKVSGEDEGELDLIVEDMGEDNPYSLGAQKIPIKKGSKITMNGNLLSGMQVIVDHDGDGISDYEAQLTRDLVGAPTTTPPTTGDTTPLGWYWLLCTVTFGLAVCFLKRSSRVNQKP
ncbi:MAG: leucine-rich repeat protein [Clostridia bacterium]|nr:leucine-rich repeat protein [Clostridia bacterium]